MSAALLLGLVYLISESKLQKNLIRNTGMQKSRKGIAEIEGKPRGQERASAGKGRVSIAADLFDKLKAGSDATTTPALMHRSLLRHANVGYGVPRAAYDKQR